MVSYMLQGKLKCWRVSAGFRNGSKFQRYYFSSEQVDKMLKEIMYQIHDECINTCLMYGESQLIMSLVRMLEDLLE